MINLLSTEDKRQLRAARTNSLLVRYVVLLGVFLVLLVAEMVGASWVLSEAKSTSQQRIDENNSKTASYAETKRRLTSYTKDLATAKYILNQQEPYTDILLRIAAALPNGSSLDRLAIDPKTFGTPTTLTVGTESYAKAIEVKASLQNSGLFTNVNFQSVVENKGQSPRYTASFNVTYSKELSKQ